MSFESSGYRESRLLPENVETDLKNWANGSVGWVLLGFSAFGWLSLLSWSVQDMHLGMATRDLRNLFGPPGAVFSDFFMSSLGLAAMFVFLPLLIWGFKIKSNLPIRNFKQRLILLPVSVLLMSGALGVIPKAESWPLTHGYGGIFGDLIFGILTNFVSTFKPAFADVISTLLLTACGVTAYLSSMELTFEDVTRAFRFENRKLPSVKRLTVAPKYVAGAVLGGSAVMVKILGDTFGRHKKISNPMPEVQGGQDIHYSSAHAAAAPAVAPEIEPIGENVVETMIEPVARPMDGPMDGPMDRPMDRPMDEQTFGQEMARGQSYHGYNQEVATTGPLPDQMQTDLLAGQSELPMDEAEAGRQIAARFAPKSARGRRRVAPDAPAKHPQVKMARAGETGAMAAAPQSVQGEKKGFFSGFERKAPTRSKAYQRPDLDMLKSPAKSKPRPDLSDSVLRGNAGLLHDVLGDFGIDGRIIDIKPGPVVTLFEFEPARGVKSSRVIALSDDIARSMSAVSARVAVVPGRNVIGIELPNMQRDVVFLSELLKADSYSKGECALPLALGKNIAGTPVVVDLARMPHLLIAGTTGSGKSVGINAMILSLLYGLSPDQCKLIMIDPKMLELSVYNDIPHLLTPVVTDPQKAVGTLNWVIREMEERYKNMSLMGVRSIGAYNSATHEAKSQGRKISRQVQTGYHPETGEAIIEVQVFEPEVLPYIVVVIDELADLMMVAGKEIEGALQRLAQMARAAGIHLIMATQRPSVDVVTGTIKANFPTRISFKVASKIDSRTILAEPGAEQLLGHGDMLYSTGPGQMSRIHGPLVEDGEVEKITQFLRSQGRPNYVEALSVVPDAQSVQQPPSQSNGNDELFERAIAIVVRDQKVSTSYIQRRLSIGYNRAADLIDRMEDDGLISPPNRTGKREILMGESENFA